MKYSLLLMLAFSCVATIAAASSSAVTATGTLYFEFDMASETQAEGVNFAKFVPDAKSLSLFYAITTGPYAAPVRYISLEPANQVLEKLLGKTEAARMLRGSQSQIEIPVKIKLSKVRTEIECDSRVYRADLVSVKSLAHLQVASSENVPNGC